MPLAPLAKTQKAPAMFQNKGNVKLYTAIVFFPGNDRRPHKYRNVKFPAFMHYAETLGAWYVNFYNQDKTYAHRTYCAKFFQEQKGPA